MREDFIKKGKKKNGEKRKEKKKGKKDKDIKRGKLSDICLPVDENFPCNKKTIEIHLFNKFGKVFEVSY